MSYQVLARKWRPQQFKELIGQEHIVRALVNALDSNRLHHAYLFTGIRGVGKTTIARILAKSLNCEKGISSEPCGECAICKDIEAGSFFDLIEVDAASRTKADETRELLSNVPYAPSSGRFKVYLIDEVHMFSNHSFNALLKTLEEPPEHVKFLLATTDPQKLPITVLSRCLQLHLKGLPEKRLSGYLKELLQRESIEHEESALALIARAADGSVRDSLSLVEQAAALGKGAITVSDVESMLGRLSADRVLDLLEAVVASDAALAMQRVEELAEYGPDYQQLLGDLLSLLHHIALSTMVPGSQRALSTLDPQRLDALCKTISDEDTQLFYQIGLHGRRDMPHAPDPREALEMTLLRMIAFKPCLDVPQSRELPPPGNSETPSAPETPPQEESQSKADTATQAPTQTATQAASQAATETETQIGSPTEPAKPEPATTPGSVARVTNFSDFKVSWLDIVPQLELKGMAGQLALNSVVSEFEISGEGQLTRVLLLVGAEHEHLLTAVGCEKLSTALQHYAAASVNVKVEVGVPDSETLAQRLARIENERQEAAERSIESDPVVQELLQKVDGIVEPSSVKPLQVES